MIKSILVSRTVLLGRGAIFPCGLGNFHHGQDCSRVPPVYRLWDCAGGGVGVCSIRGCRECMGLMVFDGWRTMGCGCLWSGWAQQGIRQLDTGDGAAGAKDTRFLVVVLVWAIAWGMESGFCIALPGDGPVQYLSDNRALDFVTRLLGAAAGWGVGDGSGWDGLPTCVGEEVLWKFAFWIIGFVVPVFRLGTAGGVQNVMGVVVLGHSWVIIALHFGWSGCSISFGDGFSTCSGCGWGLLSLWEHSGTHMQGPNPAQFPNHRPTRSTAISSVPVITARRETESFQSISAHAWNSHLNFSSEW